MNRKLNISTQKATSPSSVAVTTLYRKAARGRSPGPTGESEEWGKTRMAQRRSHGYVESAGVPPIAHEVLRAPGQALDPETRTFMESRFGHDFSRVRVHADVPQTIQAKLTIGRPGDPAEQEADRIAEQVMRMPVPAASRSILPGAAIVDGEPTIQRNPKQPYSIEEGLIVEEGGSAQAKEAPGRTPRLTSAIAARVNGLRGGGQPLSASVRAFMEPRFGHDFSQVRIHADSTAAELAAAVEARAFTVGSDIAFGMGEYTPETQAGRRLLAHELTHSIQQGSAQKLDHRLPEIAGEAEVIRRVKWQPNTDTGKDSYPWGPGGPKGDLLQAKTDAGTSIFTWKPHDGSTYWCHGYTFGGSTAKGGPYSLWGDTVPTVLKDDGWKDQPHSCVAAAGDILVFVDAKGLVTHSGIIRSVSEPKGTVDETASTLESKWGSGSHNTSSWEKNAKAYGKYRCYSKLPAAGVCSGKGSHERP
ncbi:MAG: DUF4157 domain-containing protein [Nitrospiraceae bacterium]